MWFFSCLLVLDTQKPIELQRFPGHSELFVANIWLYANDLHLYLIKLNKIPALYNDKAKVTLTKILVQQIIACWQFTKVNDEKPLAL